MFIFMFFPFLSFKLISKKKKYKVFNLIRFWTMFKKKIKAHNFLLFFVFVSHNNKNDLSHILILCQIEILFYTFQIYSK